MCEQSCEADPAQARTAGIAGLLHADSINALSSIEMSLVIPRGSFAACINLQDARPTNGMLWHMDLQWKPSYISNATSIPRHTAEAVNNRLIDPLMLSALLHVFRLAFVTFAAPPVRLYGYLLCFSNPALRGIILE